MDNPALLPCPFCGGEASIISSIYRYDGEYVECDQCGAQTHSGSWNTRAPVANAVRPLVWVKYPRADIWEADCCLGTYKVFPSTWTFDGMFDRFEQGAAMTALDKLAALIAALEAEAKAIPVGHEHAGRGSSSYNWAIYYIAKIRALTSPKVQP